MTTIEMIKEKAAELRNDIEGFLDENEEALDYLTADHLFTVEASINEWLGDGEELPE